MASLPKNPNAGASASMISDGLEFDDAFNGRWRSA